MKYEVVWTAEIRANSPEQAAKIARDMMLSDENEIFFDVHEIVWCEDAEEYHPNHDYGWQARFERSWKTIKPVVMVEWKRI